MPWLTEGLKLMVIGMGTVFLFLIVMVFVMNIVAKVIKPFAHLIEEPAAPQAKPAPTASNEDGNIVAAISAAIAKFRSDKKK